MSSLDEWSIASDDEEEAKQDVPSRIVREKSPARQLEALSLNTATSPISLNKRPSTGFWDYFSSKSNKESASQHAKKASISQSRPALDTQGSSWVHVPDHRVSLSEQDDVPAMPRFLSKEEMKRAIKPQALDILRDPSCSIRKLRVNEKAQIYETEEELPPTPLSVPPSPLDIPTASTSRSIHTPSSEASQSQTNGNADIIEESAQEQAVKRDKRRKEKFLDCLHKDTVDLSSLRKLAWSGIPTELRPLSWQLLLGYLPAPSSRRVETLARKRQEYNNSVKQVFSKGTAALDQAIWHQIHIDVPRTNPGVPLWQFEATQRSLERILYICANRHASGYVQGINDLVTPFFQVLLSSYIDCDPELFDVSLLPEGILDALEADSFWCLSKLLDGIQDNYLSEQPGIHRQVARLKLLCERVDAPLATHLATQNVEFIQFAFKWIHLLLLRVLPVDAVIRMWDTYMSEGSNAFSDYHTYVCLAFLLRSSQKLREMDFQAMMLFFQSPVEHQNWSPTDTEVLLSEGFLWKSIWSAR